jgi:iron complex transport system substrate-binding protein
MPQNLFIRMVSAMITLIAVISSCDPVPKNRSVDQEVGRVPLELKYAKRFQVWTTENTVEIAVNSGVQSGDTITYFLLSTDTEVPEQTRSHQVITVPVQDLVVTSTSHIPALYLIGATESLVGFPNTQYISSPLIRKRIDQGLVENLGDPSGLNFESLIALQPDLVVTYLSGADRSELNQMRQSGIPYVLNYDFMEETPLGRAEWIKFMGLLLGKFDQADSVFTEIENNYLMVKHSALSSTRKPTVFSGIMYGDTWFAPGANSFAARLIEDAGGTYSWSDLKVSGSAELSLEAVMDRDMETDFWIGPADFTSKAALINVDSRYSIFKAFKTDQIYNIHGRIGAAGGFEYFELAAARPDIVISDLMKIFHPDKLPDHELFFYQKLD